MKKSGSRSTKSSPSKVGRARSASSAGDEEVSIDRRRAARRGDETSKVPTTSENAPKLERRKKVNRRRQIDPTTCERDYTEQEVEFMNALDDYKHRSGRMFPTCSEVLEVLRGLGYVKLSVAELSALPVDGLSMASAKPMLGDWPASSAATGASDESSALERDPQLVY
ncbi:MAG: hypothetical protein L0228_02670 [Planctomycetes bacterium]|nr:hypothetical protein [Planctomycetota bacterium]